MVRQVGFDAILYGGDYNPDQWDEATWADDIRLMKEAGINVVTLGVFSWARLQPGPQSYDFDWFDRVLDLLHEGGLQVILATPTAAPPAWLCEAYDDILPTAPDGTRYHFGSRRHYCPNSPNYRRHAREITRALAERYGKHPAVILWHVDNEYGCHIDSCYCDRCRRAFQQWLKNRYETLDRVNEAWTTSFWGQRYTSWDQIDLPRQTLSYHNPTQTLDYRRFMTDSFLACYLEQRAILEELSPEVPVTTNFLPLPGLDYHRWAPHLDVVAWDTYPGTGADPSEVAARHDLMRGLKGGRQPFMVMEQTPSQVNWMPHNPPFRPGELRLLTFQAVAHGADGVCYFQIRQSRGGAEKFHGAVIPHGGTGRSRVYREVAQLGEELKRLASWTGAEYRAPAAVLFSWPVWWAVHQEPRINSDLDYVQEVHRYYRALWEHHVETDVVSPDGDLSRYKLVVAPVLRLVDEALARRLDDYVRSGGTLLLTFQSGLCDLEDRAHLGGYPGPLRQLAGVWVEEFDVLPAGVTNRVQVTAPRGRWSGSYQAQLWCDVVHLDGAEPLAIFERDFYAGGPAITERRVGRGRVIYVGTALEARGARDLMGWLSQELGLRPAFPVPAGVEVVRRWRGSPSGENEALLFVLNHNPHPVSVDLPGQFVDLLSGKSVQGPETLPERGVWALVSAVPARG